MSVVTASAPVDAAGAARAGDDPAERGRLQVADRVVERVAGYAVTQVPDATAAPRRVLGVTVGEAEEDDSANVRARLHGGTATVHATIAVRWPASVRGVAQQVRERIRQDLDRIVDVHVDHVDVDVVSLDPASAPTRRVR